MISYFSDRSAIIAVLERLESTTTVGVDKVALAGSKHLRVPSFFDSYKNILNEDELNYIIHRLETFDSLISLENEPDRNQLVALRMEINFAEEFIKSRIDKKKLEGMECVEHFNQNENLSCKSIEDLVGSTWF